MPDGTPFGRDFVLVFEDGRIVLDWGDGLLQDLETGDFFHGEEKYSSRKIENAELELLKRAGRVKYFNKREVFFLNLPERPAETID
jgi:hypothetical protein